MSKTKAVFAKLSLIYLELHNSSTICNYTLAGVGLAAQETPITSGMPIWTRSVLSGHRRKPHPEAV